MSNEENWTGRLIEVPIIDNLENTCYRILMDKEIKWNSYIYNNHLGALLDKLEDEYYYYDGVLYQIEKTDHSYDSITEAYVVADREDEVRFHLKFHNGGTCFNEMLECALNKLTKE